MLRTGDFRSATSAMADKLKPYGVIRIHSLSLLNSAFVGEIQTSRPLQQHVVSLGMDSHYIIRRNEQDFSVGFNRDLLALSLREFL